MKILYPALYISADESSSDSQEIYFNVIFFQFLFIFMSSILSLLFSIYFVSYILYTLFLLISISLIIFSSVKRPEEDWYQCRALAESIKTLTWRYMMRSEPFLAKDGSAAAREQFSIFLQSLLDANRRIGEPLSRRQSTGEQITKEMDYVRGLILAERMQIYRDQRIGEQREWYSNKAKIHRTYHERWTVLCIIAHLIAIVVVVYLAVYPEIYLFSVVEPLLLVASSLIGWTQLKKHSETSSAYTLAAHEIGILETRFETIGTESQFSEFVKEAELAFSREHTQWIVRRAHA